MLQGSLLHLQKKQPDKKHIAEIECWLKMTEEIKNLEQSFSNTYNRDWWNKYEQYTEI